MSYSVSLYCYSIRCCVGFIFAPFISLTTKSMEWGCSCSGVLFLLSGCRTTTVLLVHESCWLHFQPCPGKHRADVWSPSSLPCSYTVLHPALVLRVSRSSRFRFTSPANFHHYTNDTGLFSAPFLLPFHLTLLII